MKDNVLETLEDCSIVFGMAYWRARCPYVLVDVTKGVNVCFDIILSAVKRYYEMEKYIYQTNLRENIVKKKRFHF